MDRRHVDGLAANAADAGETALVVSANALLPGILSGVVLAAVLAAICSTADSQLVVAASAAANDVYARLVRRGTPSAWVNRITVLILGLGAIGLVLDPDLNVFSFVLEYGWAVLGAGYGPQVLLALWWKGATRAGAIAGIATGFGVALGWKWFYDPAATGVEIYNLPVAFIAALAVNLLVSLATDRGDREPAA